MTVKHPSRAWIVEHYAKSTGPVRAPFKPHELDDMEARFQANVESGRAAMGKPQGVKPC